jgi:hypothetical protein
MSSPASAFFVVVRKAREPARERLPGVQSFELPRGAADALDLLEVDGLEQRLAGREVAIQRSDADVGASRDALQ